MFPRNFSSSMFVHWLPLRSLCLSTLCWNSSSQMCAVAIYTGVSERFNAIFSANTLFPERWPPVMSIILFIAAKVAKTILKQDKMSEISLCIY